MLKGINPLISPELLAVLDEMGHGDEIVLADANFPCCSINARVIRADGIDMPSLLKAVLSLIPLDSYSPKDNFILMETADSTTPKIWESYESEATFDSNYLGYKAIPREEFYQRAKKAFAVVASGEKATYANIILKKGVI